MNEGRGWKSSATRDAAAAPCPSTDVARVHRGDHGRERSHGQNAADRLAPAEEPGAPP
jgi:hypothetical protein